jgi:outer membrane immunogenic protein
MKRSLVIVAALMFAAPAAQAADMALKAPLPPAPAYSWTGCYLGVHAGGGAMNATFVDEWGGGGVAGGQIGCNYQIEHLVVGIEGEGYWSSLKSTYTDIFPPGSDNENDSARNKWDFDVALRAGFAWDRTLVYGKAGVAWGRFAFNEGFTEPCGFLGPGLCSINETGSTTLPGLLLGFGGEYAFASAPNWSVKLEYNFIDYFARAVPFNELSTFTQATPFVETFSTSATKQIVKVGLNYKFGP